MLTREEVVAGTCQNIIKAAGMLRKDLDSVLSAAGISGPQFGILSQLEAYGSMPLSELGKRLWVSCGNVTGLIDRLVAAGYVRRIRLNTDRRVILAEITDRGKTIMRELHPVHIERLARFTSALDEDELNQLQVLLDKVCCSTIEGD